MDTIEIKYSFKFDDQQQEVIDLQLDSRTLAVVNRASDGLPEWTRLDYHQCSHCPLDIPKKPYCPVAVSLVDVATRFCNVASHEAVDLEVVIGERKISQYTVAQRGVSSLIGLLISTSGCPHTDFFKPMARFHLPLSSEEDTVFRVTGMYLMGQYFRKKGGQQADLDFQGLSRIYQNIHLLNVKIAERLRSAIEEDSSLNAVAVLDVFTHNFHFVIEEELADLRQFFHSYLAESYHALVEDIE